jgi:hypothetical protein
MAISNFGFGGDAALGHPSSTAANADHYPASIRSRSTRLDDFASHPGGPVPIDLRSRTDFVSVGSAALSVDAGNPLRQPRSLDLDPRFIDLEHLRPQNLHLTENDPTSACALLPLQSDRTFRLLELLHGQGSAPLEIRLIEASVESTYEVLSCVVDNTSFPLVNINIYTGAAVTEVAIAPNLANALKALRYPENPRKLWTDALCVNQKDTTEKSAQVARMGDIISNAKNLCIWLGSPSRESDQAFKLIALCTDLGKFEALSQNLTFISFWEALIQLMKRPWFRRRWSVFEICFARSAIVHCGYQRVGWEEFKRAVFFVNTKHHGLRNIVQSANARYLDSLHDVAQLDANRLIQLADMTVRKSTSGDVLQCPQPLDVLMFNCAWMDCRDPRDTIYALLGLSRRVSRPPRVGGPFSVAAHQSSATHPDQGIHNMESATEYNATCQQQMIIHTSKLPVFDAIKIDYAKSVFEICRDFSLYTVDHLRSLDIICRPWAPQGQDLPSWMPSVFRNSYVIGKDGFYKRAAADPLIGNSNQSGPTAYSAALETEPTYRYDPAINPRELSLLGFVCGEVVAKQIPATAGLLPWSWFDGNDFFKSARDAKASFCRTIVANRGPASPYRIPAYYPSVWDYITEQRATGIDLDTTEFRVAEKPDSIADEFLARVQATVWGRRLLLAGVGDAHLLALGPAHVKKRDLICILHGCSVPVLLRKLDPREYPSNGVQYRLIGECYVDGIMNGEAFDMKGKKMEYFALV